MKTLFNIILSIPFFCAGQRNVYTGQLDRAESFYQAKKSAEARLVIDSAITNPEFRDHYETWTLRAYIYFEQYKPTNRRKIHSALRDTVVSSVKKSNNLKPDSNYTIQNKKIITTISSGYYNLAKTLLQDSLNLDKSLYCYNKFKEVLILNDATYNFRTKDIEYYKAAGSVMVDLISREYKTTKKFDQQKYLKTKGILNRIDSLTDTKDTLSIIYSPSGAAKLYLETLFLSEENSRFKTENNEKQILLELSNTKNALSQLKVEKQKNYIEFLNANVSLSKLQVEKQKKGIELLNKEKALKEALVQKQSIEAKNREEEIKQQRIIKNISFASIGLLFIVVFLIYRNLNRNKKQNKIILEQKREVEKQNAVILLQKQDVEKQREITEDQKRLVEEKQHETLDSIHYAKRIQYALLASDGLLNHNLPEYFVLFKPKDVVSGDFYWATPTPEGFVYITADCTGHGVPGAFMSLLNITKLSQTINENNITRPDLVLNNVRSEIIKALNPEGSSEESKDGMDAILCKLDLETMKLECAAANYSFFIIRNKEVLHCKADKMPVGKGHDDTISFTHHLVLLEKGDIIYTFTDGLPDQFGGPKGKKFKRKQLEKILLEYSSLKLEKQKEILSKRFDDWKGELEQVDDICIIGVQV